MWRLQSAFLTDPGVAAQDRYAKEIPVTTPVSTTYSPTTPSSTTEAAASEAKEVVSTAASAGGEVAGVAKEQASQVIGESVDQAKDLVSSLASTLQAQLHTQTGKVGEHLSALSTQLTEGDTSGVVGQVLNEVGTRLRTLADHVQQSGPEGVLADLRSYARRSPGSFLLGAAAAGLVTGRLTKGLTAGKNDTAPASTSSVPEGLPATFPPISPVPVAGAAVVDPYPPTTVLGGLQ